MKKYTILLVLLLINTFIQVSCTKFPNEKKLIKDHIQTFVGTELDLKIEFKEFEVVKTITYQDSLDYLIPKFSDNLKIRANSYNDFELKIDSIINYNNLMIDSLYGLKQKVNELYKLYQDGWEREYSNYYRKKKNETEATLKYLDDNDIELRVVTDLASNYHNQLSKYYKNPSTIIGTLYKVKFKAFNPFLKTDQTIDTYFLVNMNTKYVERINATD
ncbi:MAG: hypothetical protein Q8O72_05530 [Bacteroidales bacterium]|nr:hypothetical protein [Bacteroidales bacterium]